MDVPVSSLGCTELINRKEFGRKRLWPDFRYCLCICEIWSSNSCMMYCYVFGQAVTDLLMDRSALVYSDKQS
jgi:hypothetical protein